MGVDDLRYSTRPAAGSPESALVLLHGRGADENDLFPLFDLLDPSRRMLGVAPRGPLSLPPGGAHWYALHRVGYPDPPTFLATLARLGGWLEDLSAQTGIDIEQMVLGGFSQGAVMAYSLAFRREGPRPRALVALSGFMPNVPNFDLDLDGLNGFPVAISHGTFDPIIEVAWGRQARDRLVEAGAAVTYREFPMGHSIDPSFLSEVATELLPA